MAFVMLDRLGLMQRTNTVLALPPKEFFNSLVRVEFLYGICESLIL